MTWIVLTNTNNCRIYSLDQERKTVTLLNELNHPENRKKTSEYFTSDKPGSYQGSGMARGTYAHHTVPKATGIRHFAIEISQALDQGRTQNAYKKLILIAPPQMLGLLHDQCNKHVKQIITQEISKDLVHYKDHELLQFITQNQF